MVTLARYETTALDQARDTAISRALDMAEDMMIELGVHDTIKALQDLPGKVSDEQHKVVICKAQIDTHKANALAAAREALDMAVLEASMEAPNDGKNEKARELQLQSFLAGQSKAAADVRWAKSALANQEKVARDLESNLALAEADLDHAKNRLRGALATAELQSAVLRATRVS